MTHVFKNRFTDAVIYEGESGLTTRQNLEKATASRADLSSADLYGADLSSADLSRANLYGANLYGANLYGANLYGADLSSAKFDSEKVLIGKRPYFAIGPIGSHCANVTLWLTDKGPMVKAGCFTGTLDEFVVACERTHGDSDHGKEYAMAVLMFEAHISLWTPAE